MNICYDLYLKMIIVLIPSWFSYCHRNWTDWRVQLRSLDRKDFEVSTFRCLLWPVFSSYHFNDPGSFNVVRVKRRRKRLRRLVRYRVLGICRWLALALWDCQTKNNHMNEWMNYKMFMQSKACCDCSLALQKFFSYHLQKQWKKLFVAKIWRHRVHGTQG